MSLTINSSTREIGDVTSPGELPATKMPESALSHVDELSYSANDSGFVPIAALEQHMRGSRVQGLLGTSKCERKYKASVGVGGNI